MIWIELVILLACIVIGARLGGIALGTVAGIGLAVFVFVFALPPGGPPPGVLGMIIAVITALATMQAAGGLDYLVSLAERIMQKHPQYITFIAPVVTYVLVFASGTTHVIYALLPVIAEVSRKGNIRPERPLSISVIAGFHGNIASPISAATVACSACWSGKASRCRVCSRSQSRPHSLPCLIGALSVAWRGKKLDEDPEYQKRLASGEVKAAGSVGRAKREEPEKCTRIDAVVSDRHRRRRADRHFPESASGVPGRCRRFDRHRSGKHGDGDNDRHDRGFRLNDDLVQGIS